MQKGNENKRKQKNRLTFLIRSSAFWAKKNEEETHCECVSGASCLDRKRHKPRAPNLGAGEVMSSAKEIARYDHT